MTINTSWDTDRLTTATDRTKDREINNTTTKLVWSSGGWNYLNFNSTAWDNITVNRWNSTERTIDRE